MTRFKRGEPLAVFSSIVESETRIPISREKKPHSYLALTNNSDTLQEKLPRAPISSATVGASSVITRRERVRRSNQSKEEYGSSNHLPGRSLVSPHASPHLQVRFSRFISSFPDFHPLHPSRLRPTDKKETWIHFYYPTRYGSPTGVLQ